MGLGLVLAISVFAVLGVVLFALWHRLCGDLWVSPTLLFGGHEMLYVWPAMLWGVTTGYSQQGYLPVVLAASCFASYLIGATVSAGLVGRFPERLASFRAAAVDTETADGYGWLAAVLSAALLATVGIILYRGLPPLIAGLLELARGASVLEAVDTLTTRRDEVTKGYYFGIAYRGQGVMLDLSLVGWESLVIFCAASYKTTRERRWLALTVGAVFGFLFFIGGSAQRWQTLMGFVVVFIGLSLITRWRVWHLVLLGGGLIALYSGMSLLNSQFLAVGDVDNASGYVLSLLVERIFLGNGIHDLDVINLIGSGALDFGAGSIHADKLMAALPGVSSGEVPFSLRVASLLNYQRGDETFASQTYLGWLYADVGMWGSIIVYGLLGGVIVWAQLAVASAAKRVELMPFYGIVFASLATMSTDGPIGAAQTIFVAAVLTGCFVMLRRGLLTVAAAGRRPLER
jgi:hypothetical protein